MERQKGNTEAGGRSNLRSTSSSNAAMAMRPAGKGFMVTLPKEFERSFSDYFDRRYTIILLCTFVVHFTSIMIFLANPPKEEFSQKDILRIQQQFASLILEKEPIKTEEPTAESQSGGQQSQAKNKDRDGGEDADEAEEARKARKQNGDSKETKTASAEERSQSRGSAADSRRRSREQISNEVASKGLLGVLTAGGGSGQGDAVVDVLGDGNNVSSNIGSVLNEIGGIKTTGAPVSGNGAAGGSGSGKGVRGGRTSAGGGIDDLIGDLGTASSTEIKRKGSLMVAEEVSLEDGPGGAKASGRDRDQIMTVVNSHNSAIQACFQRALKRNPDLKGKVVVRFTISHLGKITNVEVVSSTLNEASVERCITSRIRHWDDFGVIDASKGDATVRQVYTFGY